jgi:hypothetical protein
MDDTDKLDCKIFVDSDVSVGELARLLANFLGGSVSGPAFGATVTTTVGDIEIRKNPDHREGVIRESPDRFLFSRDLLEVYPNLASAREERVSLVRELLAWLRSRGWPAVAACDYEVDSLENNSQLMAYLDECDKRAHTRPRKSLVAVKRRLGLDGNPRQPID